MQKHAVCASAFFLVLAWGQGGSETARAETLADTLVEAYLTSPELEASRANVKIRGELAVQARANGRLQVSGTADLPADFTDLNRFSFPPTLQLDVVQPLYTGGQVENATEAAETRIDAEEARLIATEQSVLLDAISAYLSVRRDISLLELARNNVRVITEQLRAARERFDVGEVTRTDVAQAEARLAASRSTLAARQGSLQSSREAFKRAVGRYPGELEPPPPLPDLPKTLDDAINLALTSDPNVAAARLERLAAGSDVRSAIGALLPQISLEGQVSRFSTMIDDGPSESDARIGLRITLPFYSGGRNYSAVREAQAQVEGRAADINSQLRAAAERAGIAWSDLDVARASIKAGVLEVRAQELAFEGVQEEAKVGARTTLDVLDAEQELLDARGGLTVSRTDEYISAYSLLFAVGKLTVEHLGLDVQAYDDASGYYSSVRNRNFGYDASDDTVWSLSYRP